MKAGRPATCLVWGAVLAALAQQTASGQEDAVELETLQVTGQVQASEHKTLLQSTAVLSGEELRVKSGATIGEMHEQRLQRGRLDYLQVLSVAKGSSAEETGFRTGDVIFSINKQLTRSFDEVFEITKQSGSAMIMNIQRGNRELYLLLK